MTEPNTRPERQNLDNLEENQDVKPAKKWGGYRPNSGRPAHSKNVTTKMREATKQAMIDRIHRNVEQLLNAQLTKALGEQYLMVKRTERDSKGKVLRVYHEVVEHKQTIIDYLDGELEVGDSISDSDNYYYMTTKAPDNMALQALLDRGFGRADSKFDITSDGEKIERGMSLEAIDAILARADAEAARHNAGNESQAV